jgi:NAD(P)-dependent dehydrogenase (short-subunit alcohol dehydrogenase family)
VNLKDKILDKTIFLSFDRSGFERHLKYFKKRDLESNVAGKICLVTGANSGIGFETAMGLAKRGAKVILLCRNSEKGAHAVSKLRKTLENPDVEVKQIDVSDLSSVRRFVDQFKEKKVDVLIHNAGVLPLKRDVTREGIELTLATNLIGPFLLTHLLMPKLMASNQSRVITVSSGGMYLQKLDLRNLQSTLGKFSGVKAYANTKRAEVIVNKLWSNFIPKSKVTFNTMHPGWVDTPGVQNSLPKFWQVMKSKLRTPEQGADTIVWLANSNIVRNRSGQFWFDRRQVSPDVFPWTRESSEDRKQLWNCCIELSGAQKTQN